jgi:carboxyl-terminal processing protease
MKKSILLLLVSCGLSINGYPQAMTDSATLDKQQKLLVSVGKILEDKHYLPQPIDNKFSGAIWEMYIKHIDPRKEIFLQSDIDGLKRFEHSIDEEIHGYSPISFLPAILAIYRKRYEETWVSYQKVLHRKLDFKKTEKGLPVRGYATFPATKSVKAEVDRKHVKLLVLQALMASTVKNQKQAIETVRKQLTLQQKRVTSQMDEGKQFTVFLNTIVKRMDPHSDYFSPEGARSYQEDISNRFFGIGTQLQEKDGMIRINELEPGGPAFKSNMITVGDVITGVGEGKNGVIVDVLGLPINEVTPLIRGKKGTTVTLSLRKGDGSTATISILREEVIQEDGLLKVAILKQGTQKTGYILLPKFYDDSSNPDGPHCARDVAAALNLFRKEDVNGVIMDLRSNGEGSLREVVKMVELFVNGGPVVQVRSRGGKTQGMIDSRTEQLYNGPLVVMVNALSASASEIFTAAIQDYHRGNVLGSTSTYGKGSVQSSMYVDGIPEHGAIKLTQQLFYRISGSTTQMKGVISDIVLPDIYEYQKIREKDNDNFLAFDTIAPLNYNPENSFDLAKVTTLSSNRLKADTVFHLLSNNINLLAKDQQADIALDSVSYREMTQHRQKIANQDELLLKLPIGKELRFAPLKPSDSENKRYLVWLTKVNADIYIDQAVKVLVDILNTLSV